jgi:hypothetical protein
MRILFAVPHYFDPAGKAADGRVYGSLSQRAERRLQAVSTCLTALHQLFGRPQCLMDFAGRTTVPANQLTARQLDVVLCTTRGRHLLDGLPLGPGYFTHHPTDVEPLLLEFECHAVLRDRLGDYDYYCFLEDDLILHDPWFFVKLAWFTGHVGDDCLLQPNRYEVARDAIVHKAYIDGELAERATAPFQDTHDSPPLVGDVLGVRALFRRTGNPHAACFFLNARQMEHWARQPYFLDRDTRFVGPLESAATLGIMRTFKIYKPAPENAAFLEVEHFGNAFLSRIRTPAPV